MDKEWKRKWLKALRSGNYSQGHNRLVKIASPATWEKLYCCLGVLCEIHPDVEIREASPNSSILEVEYTGEHGLSRHGHHLPRGLAEEVGLTAAVQRTLARLNDGCTEDGCPTDPKPFKEIANWIEENL